MGIGRLSPPRRCAVFLDRDGVLNRAIVRDGKPFPPSTVRVDSLTSAVDWITDAGVR